MQVDSLGVAPEDIDHGGTSHGEAKIQQAIPEKSVSAMIVVLNCFISCALFRVSVVGVQEMVTKPCEIGYNRYPCPPKPKKNNREWFPTS